MRSKQRLDLILTLKSLESAGFERRPLNLYQLVHLSFVATFFWFQIWPMKKLAVVKVQKSSLHIFQLYYLSVAQGLTPDCLGFPNAF